MSWDEHTVVKYKYLKFFQQSTLVNIGIYIPPLQTKTYSLCRHNSVLHFFRSFGGLWCKRRRRWLWGELENMQHTGSPTRVNTGSRPSCCYPQPWEEIDGGSHYFLFETAQIIKKAKIHKLLNWFRGFWN